MTKMHFSALSFALLLPLGGCEVQDCDNEETGADGLCLKSLKRWTAPDETMDTGYTAGASVTIDSPNGDVRVVRGDSTDTVSATFERFVLRAHDTPDEEAEADLDSLERSIGPNGNGNVVVDVSRPSGSPSSLGADITVALPTSFDGVLEVDQNNGSTEIDFVGAAVGVIVTSDNGGCDIRTGSASDVSVHCDNGDLTASIDEVSAQTGSGFSTGNGSIELSLPSEGVFSVQAQALDGGVVTINRLPDTCGVNEASDAAKTVSCNGATTQDPIYVADAQGTSLANVILNF
jgi:hypothetical protein